MSLDSPADTRAFVQNALTLLKQAPETINPALALCLRLARQEDPSLIDLTRLDHALTESMIVGDAEARASEALLGLLRDLPPIPGPDIPVGF